MLRKAYSFWKVVHKRKNNATYKHVHITVHWETWKKQLHLQAIHISHHTVPNSNCLPILTAEFFLQVWFIFVSQPGAIFSQVRFVHRLLGEPPLGQSSPKWKKLMPDSSRTSMRSFTPLSFCAAEKSNRTNTGTKVNYISQPYYCMVG